MSGDEVWWKALAKIAVPSLIAGLLGGMGGAAVTKNLLAMSHAGYYVAAAGYLDFQSKDSWVDSTRGSGWKQTVQHVSFEKAVECDHPFIQTSLSAFDIRREPAAAGVIDANTNAAEVTKFGFPMYVQTEAANLAWVNVHWMALCPLQ